MWRTLGLYWAAPAAVGSIAGRPAPRRLPTAPQSERRSRPPRTAATTSRSSLVEERPSGSRTADGLRDAWVAAENGKTVVVTGTLDNQAELDARLGRSGRHNPAATVLAAFEAWGAAAPAELRGVFAGAWSDGAEHVVFRDHLGLAPLFHREDRTASSPQPSRSRRRPPPESHARPTWSPWRRCSSAASTRAAPCSAASTAFPARRRRPSRPAAAPPSPATGIPSASSRPPASDCPRRGSADGACRAGGRPQPDRGRRGLAERRDRLADDRGVRGSDTRELTGEPLLAVSSVYPEDPGVDESRWIELVTDYLGLRLHAYTPSSRPLDDLEYWVDVLDGPVDTMSIPELAENYALARELGARNVLTGEMAEWVFTFGQHLIGHLVLHGRLRAALAWTRDQRARGALERHRQARRPLPRLAQARARLPAPARPRGLPPASHLGRTRGRRLPGPRPDLARPARRRWLEHQLDPLVGVGAYSFDADASAPRSAACMSAARSSTSTCGSSCSRSSGDQVPDAVPKSLLRGSVRGRLPDELLDRADKTFFNDFALRTADYEGIRRWALSSELRIEGVDYALLEAPSARGMSTSSSSSGLRPRARHAFLGSGRDPARLVLRLEVRSSLPARLPGEGPENRSKWRRRPRGPAPRDRPSSSGGRPRSCRWTPTLLRAGFAFLRIADAVFSVDLARWVEVPKWTAASARGTPWGIPRPLASAPAATSAPRGRGSRPTVAGARRGAAATYGKTTMAAGNHRAGRRVLGEEPRCVLGLEGASEVVLGPAMLRPA